MKSEDHKIDDVGCKQTCITLVIDIHSSQAEAEFAEEFMGEGR